MLEKTLLAGEKCITEVSQSLNRNNKKKSSKAHFSILQMSEEQQTDRTANESAQVIWRIIIFKKTNNLFF